MRTPPPAAAHKSAAPTARALRQIISPALSPRPPAPPLAAHSRATLTQAAPTGMHAASGVVDEVPAKPVSPAAPSVANAWSRAARLDGGAPGASAGSGLQPARVGAMTPAAAAMLSEHTDVNADEQQAARAERARGASLRGRGDSVNDWMAADMAGGAASASWLPLQHGGGAASAPPQRQLPSSASSSSTSPWDGADELSLWDRYAY